MRKLAALLTAVTLSACAAGIDGTDGSPEPLGDFRLGFSEVVAPNLQRLFVSETASAEEWTEAVDRAIETRLGRFDGTRFYHLGISVEGYSLPPPIVPGESYLAMRVTVWDDAEQAKLKQEAELVLSVIVFENRLGMTREQRIDSLARTAARDVENWLRKQQREVGWFGGPNATPRRPQVAGPIPAPVTDASPRAVTGGGTERRTVETPVAEAADAADGAGGGPLAGSGAVPGVGPGQPGGGPAALSTEPDAPVNDAEPPVSPTEQVPENGPGTVPEVESTPLS